jgi:hypothetical protein
VRLVGWKKGSTAQNHCGLIRSGSCTKPAEQEELRWIEVTRKY